MNIFIKKSDILFNLILSVFPKVWNTETPNVCLFINLIDYVSSYWVLDIPTGLEHHNDR